LIGVKRSHARRNSLETKKPAHPGNGSPERLALNSSFHIPL
jgi:hypothetical protein